jgi:hypothetical protein
MRKQAVDKVGYALERSAVTPKTNKKLGAQTLTPEELQFLDLLAGIFVSHLIKSNKHAQLLDDARSSKH